MKDSGEPRRRTQASALIGDGVARYHGRVDPRVRARDDRLPLRQFAGGAATGGGATKSSATIRGRRSVRAAAEEPGAAAAAVRYDDIIAVLREAPIDGLDAAVDAVKLELTTGFYEHAVRRIDACRSAG